MAYYNKTVNDGPLGSFMADPNGSDIGIYLRCKFVNPSGVTPDGKPILQLAGASDRGDFVPWQPITAGLYGTGKFQNFGGEQYGVMSGLANSGDDVYAAANGKIASTGSVKIGKFTSPGSDGNVATYVVNSPAA